MKRRIAWLAVILFSCLLLGPAFAVAGSNLDVPAGPFGPAPNSGDGVPDGSDLDAPNGPIGSGPETSPTGSGTTYGD